jgi:hypothetical protein
MDALQREEIEIDYLLPTASAYARSSSNSYGTTTTKGRLAFDDLHTPVGAATKGHSSMDPPVLRSATIQACQVQGLWFSISRGSVVSTAAPSSHQVLRG